MKVKCLHGTGIANIVAKPDYRPLRNGDGNRRHFAIEMISVFGAMRGRLISSVHLSAFGAGNTKRYNILTSPSEVADNDYLLTRRIRHARRWAKALSGLPRQLSYIISIVAMRVVARIMAKRRFRRRVLIKCRRRRPMARYR